MQAHDLRTSDHLEAYKLRLYLSLITQRIERAQARYTYRVTMTNIAHENLERQHQLDLAQWLEQMDNPTWTRQQKYRIICETGAHRYSLSYQYHSSLRARERRLRRLQHHRSIYRQIIQYLESAAYMDGAAWCDDPTNISDTSSGDDSSPRGNN